MRKKLLSLSRLLACLLLSLAWGMQALWAIETNPTAVSQLLDRIGGAGTSDRFVTKLDASLSTNGQDCFVITAESGKPCIKGNSVIAVTTGINWYLNHYAHVNLTWNNLTTDLSTVTLPVPTAEEKHDCSVDYRYYLNYCTFSYSMSTWTWDRWQKEIDWMALHGVNMPLQIVGLDVVWYRLLTEKYGYSKAEANKFIAGPCFQAWWGMNNLEGWGGPNPAWWYKRQQQLAGQILGRMRQLGMEPVLPGFCGMVPSNFTTKTGNAANNQGNWCGFTRPYILDPNSEVFKTMAANYYAILKEVMGTSVYYSMDPFHEGASTDGIDVPSAYTAIYNAMKAANDNIDEKWVIQYWQWSKAQYNVLDKVPVGDLIVLDLFSDAHTHFGDYKGHNAVYCSLPNFGGRTGFFGRLNGIINGFFDNKAAHSNIKGIGATPEAIESVPIMYDALFELPWYSSKPDPKQWVADYAINRYGTQSTLAQEAWELLRNSSLNCTSGLQGPMEGVVCARPNLQVDRVSSWGGTGIFYDPQDVARAACNLLEARLSGENYSYDLTDLSRQTLTDYAYYLLQAINDAHNAKNTELFNARRDAYLQLMLDLDELLNTNKDFIVGRWTQMARGIADEVNGQTIDGTTFSATDADRNWLELNNARTLITTWGDRDQANNGGLRDYSYRMWGGIMKDYYYARWKTFFDNDLHGSDWFDMEWKWAHNSGGTVYSYSNTTTGSTAEVANRLFDKYFVKLSLTDGKTHFAYRTMDNALGNKLVVDGFRGENLVLPFTLSADLNPTLFVDFNNDGQFGKDESVTNATTIAIPATSATAKVKASVKLSDGTSIQFYATLKDNITEARTVSVATENAAHGSVAIEGKEGTSVSSTDYLTLVATPAAGYDFLNWTNAAGEVVSTDASFTYYGAAAETFTAHFLINKWGSPTEDRTDYNDIVGYRQYVQSFTLTQYGEETELYSVKACPDKLFQTVSKQITAAPGGSFTINWTDAGGLQYTYLSAYIDLNSDGEFDKNSELLAVKGSHKATSSAPCSGPLQITLPFDTPEGLTHIRLRFDGAWKTGYDATTGAFDAKATANRMVYDILVNVEKPAKKAVTVSVVSGNTDRGTVDANGQPDTHTYPVGEQVILRAYPKEGYKIDYWQDQYGRKLPSSWMEENMIKFAPYDNATITAVFAPSTVLTYNDWKFRYELINDKIFITTVDQQGSSDLDLTQTNALGKELMGISPATFPNLLGLTALKLPASCTSLDNYLNTAVKGAGTENVQIVPETAIPGSKPWKLTLCATTDGSVFNQYGSALLATGTNSFADDYTGGFQLYWAAAGTLTAKVNGSGENKFPTAASEKFVITMDYDGAGNLSITLQSDDKAAETKTFSGVTLNDISTFSHSIPAGINITSLFINDPTLHSLPFKGCKELTKFDVEAGNKVFTASDDNLCAAADGKLLVYPEGKLFCRAYVLENASTANVVTSNPPADREGNIYATDYNNAERRVSTATETTAASLFRLAKSGEKQCLYHFNSGGFFGGKADGGGNGQQIEMLALAQWAGDYTLALSEPFTNELVAPVTLSCADLWMAEKDGKFILSNEAPAAGNASQWKLKEAKNLSVTVGSSYWTDFAFPVNVVLPEVSGVAFYKTVSANSDHLTLEAIPAGSVVAAGEGIIVYAEQPQTLQLPITYEAAQTSRATTNWLSGATARRTGFTAGDNYLLTTTDGVSYASSSETEVQANRAYFAAKEITGTVFENSLSLMDQAVVNNSGLVYKKITNASQLENGATYVLLSEAQSVMLQEVSNGKGQPASAFLSADILAPKTLQPQEFVLEKYSNYYKLGVSGDSYLNASISSPTNLAIGDSKDESKWTIAFDDKGNALLQCTKSPSRYVSVSTLSDNKFGNYDDTAYGTDTYKAVQLYQKVYNIRFAEPLNGMATLYNPNAAYKMPEGLEGYVVTDAPTTGSVTTQIAYTANEIVPEGTALLLKGAVGNSYAPATTLTAKTVDFTNWLHGQRDAKGMTYVDGDFYFYKLSVDDSMNNPGFYWGAEGGAAFKLNKPYTAYLAVPKSYSTAAILLFDLQTSIEDALKAANAEGEPIFDLSGRRVVKPTKGIYLLNGRKVVFE